VSKGNSPGDYSPGKMLGSRYETLYYSQLSIIRWHLNLPLNLTLTLH